MDFVLYGKRGFHAIVVQRSARVRDEDLASLQLFLSDYPAARGTLVYAGARSLRHGSIDVVPVETFLRSITARLGS